MDTEEEIVAAATKPKNASWGAIISIVIILAMIVIGAFYSFNKRTDLQHPVETAATSTQK